jgi:hypothetical protein
LEKVHAVDDAGTVQIKMDLPLDAIVVRRTGAISQTNFSPFLATPKHKAVPRSEAKTFFRTLSLKHDEGKLMKRLIMFPFDSPSILCETSNVQFGEMNHPNSNSFQTCQSRFKISNGVLYGSRHLPELRINLFRLIAAGGKYKFQNKFVIPCTQPYVRIIMFNFR